MYKYFHRSRLYNREMDNNDNSSREILSKIHIFRMRNYYAVGPLDSSCKKDTGITVLVVCGFPKCREGEVPPYLFYQSHVTKYGTVVTKAMAS